MTPISVVEAPASSNFSTATSTHSSHVGRPSLYSTTERSYNKVPHKRYICNLILAACSSASSAETSLKRPCNPIFSSCSLYLSVLDSPFNRRSSISSHIIMPFSMLSSALLKSSTTSSAWLTSKSFSVAVK
ncbi:hypothetical protein V8G54_036232 [Vigna mungo]|uniref:Uncharacterized protein n=1 Tax=Vigna mungo TaxID=3915 RepID=A0AAQ3RF94_VIGMU